MNTPAPETERLILRCFTEDDLEAVLTIFGDEAINRFLPWFPLKNAEEARAFYDKRFADRYRQGESCAWAVCLKEDNVPIGYVWASTEDSHDLGYGLRRAWWGQGIITEAARAVIERMRQEGIPWITATHDVHNPRSGRVMQRLGMRYCYTYLEQWQPKGIPVHFRMYQLNLDGHEHRVYRRYWDMYPVHFVEDGL